MREGDAGDSTALTTVDHWDAAYKSTIRMRLPSALLASTVDSRREIRQWVRPGDQVLEIGFAPGKQLAWVASALGAQVSGIDFSEPGVALSRRLFDTLGLQGDLRCEDVFNTSFEFGTFDVVYSQGVIEHWDDPRPIVRQHMELLRPGGVAVISVPNYGGIYGRLQGHIDPENLSIHNTRIMNFKSLAELMPSDITDDVRVRATGRLTAGLINFDRVIPSLIAQALFWGTNVIGHLQPFEV
ncbi:MAG: methyltransferase domain-containing protein, partial [Gemmatimonadaceae bacterium]